MAEKALHMALLVVHAILVARKTFWTMAFNTVGDFFRRRPFRRLPSSLEVFIEMMHHGIDDLSTNGIRIPYGTPQWTLYSSE
jgi:hypothetical protein